MRPNIIEREPSYNRGCSLLPESKHCETHSSLQSATSASSLSSGAVGRNRGHVLDSSDLDAVSGESAKSGLRSRSRSLGLASSGSSDLDMKSRDTTLLASRGDVLGGKHSSVRAGLVTIGLDLHSSGDTGDGLSSGEIGHVHEGIVEGSENVSDTEGVLPVRNFGAILLFDLFGGNFFFVIGLRI